MISLQTCHTKGQIDILPFPLWIVTTNSGGEKCSYQSIDNPERDEFPFYIFSIAFVTDFSAGGRYECQISSLLRFRSFFVQLQVVGKAQFFVFLSQVMVRYGHEFTTYSYVCGINILVSAGDNIWGS